MSGPLRERHQQVADEKPRTRRHRKKAAHRVERLERYTVHLKDERTILIL